MENKTYFYVLQAFEVDEDQIVVAETAKQARDWYMGNITTDYVYDLTDVKPVFMENRYYYDESRTTLQTLKENIREHLTEGGQVPFLAVTTDA